jgi:riboflavin biosynthesis pyrimidine reductase
MWELVKQFLHQKPFKPFRIVIDSGERFDIVDRLKIAIRKPKVYIVCAPNGRERVKEVHEKDIAVVYEPRMARY